MVDAQCSKPCLKAWLTNNLLLVLTMVGVVVGFVVAFTVQPLNPSIDAIIWIGMTGELFLRGLQLLIIPLVVSSTITATGSMHARSSGRLSVVTFIYIFAAMVVAVTTGLILSVIIRPGRTGGGSSDADLVKYQAQDTFADLFRNLIPNNIVGACIQVAYTEYETQEVIAEGVNGTNVTTTQITGKSVGMTSGTNLLGIVVFCIALGLSMSTDRESSKPLLDFMLALRSNIFKIFTVYIWSLPVATASLIAASLLRVDDIYGIWASLGLFAATVIIGLALHEFLWMPLAYFISTRNNPFTVYYKCGKAIFTAVVSRSSAATLPVLFKCCEVGLRFHKRVCSFVLPISMFKGDGSALFIICSCIWLGQRSEMGLAAGQIVLMGVLTVFLTFCLPAVPSASLVGIVLICESANVPSEEVGLLISMEWLLDALRTVVNVSSHGICAGLGNHFMEGAFNLDDEDEESGFDDRSSDQPEKRGNCDENIKLMDGNGKELGESGSDTKL
ncbi:excitatory amino acid transporter 1-like isoform X1 [Ptychodera flava]|uniref:excitatory amino acid transporter 1-like isoform X1 n=1 Tax=Ptychodera flava TaxID=63121 RepID=UPI00396AA04A